MPSYRARPIAIGIEPPHPSGAADEIEAGVGIVLPRIEGGEVQIIAADGADEPVGQDGEFREAVLHGVEIQLAELNPQAGFAIGAR